MFGIRGTGIRRRTGYLMAHRRLLARAPRFEHCAVWIISPGGVATTMLIEHVSRYVPTNERHDKDGLKHWPAPPARRLDQADSRVLFVKGEAVTIAASIARRARRCGR
ncbi:hypothetical protein [Alteraurantiacibacter buctensis]|uniref:Uncharacterized protein n=1 Tax=Alteraurantiacibacter buctensis TaxID=1503981 RepID=A0A844YV11_9SPHN|nr:hypothetical protein [Alteraurantiacibacter buctensis]MXO70324.1 hypothetical protein [Alteraurantiacibacter buctensis]